MNRDHIEGNKEFGYIDVLGGDGGPIAEVENIEKCYFVYNIEAESSEIVHARIKFAKRKFYKFSTTNIDSCHLILQLSNQITLTSFSYNKIYVKPSKNYEIPTFDLEDIFLKLGITWEFQGYNYELYYDYSSKMVSKIKIPAYFSDMHFLHGLFREYSNSVLRLEFNDIVNSERFELLSKGICFYSSYSKFLFLKNNMSFGKSKIISIAFPEIFSDCQIRNQLYEHVVEGKEFELDSLYEYCSNIIRTVYKHCRNLFYIQENYRKLKSPCIRIETTSGTVEYNILEKYLALSVPMICPYDVEVHTEQNFIYFGMAIEYLYALDDMSNINEFKKLLMEQYLKIH